jgi:hypothetical protein
MMLALAACSSSSVDVSAPAGGSSSSSSSSSGTGEPPPEVEDTRPCGVDGPKHHAFLREGTCSEVPGKDGKWIARTLFPDAPEEIRSRACTYRWSTALSAPDVAALRNLPLAHVTPNCEPGIAAVVPQGRAKVLMAPSIGAPTGVSGCDVCARLSGKHVFLILPAERLDFRGLTVGTNGGTFLSFGVTPPAEKVQAFSVELPPAPNGGTYVEGGLYIFEHTSF